MELVHPVTVKHQRTKTIDHIDVVLLAKLMGTFCISTSAHATNHPDTLNGGADALFDDLIREGCRDRQDDTLHIFRKLFDCGNARYTLHLIALGFTGNTW